MVQQPALFYRALPFNFNTHYFHQKERKFNQSKRELISLSKRYQSYKKISCGATAKLYNVPESTVRRRINGRTRKTDSHPVAQNLTTVEEELLVRYILDLNSRWVLPSIRGLREMVDRIRGNTTIDA